MQTQFFLPNNNSFTVSFEDYDLDGSYWEARVYDSKGNMIDCLCQDQEDQDEGSIPSSLMMAIYRKHSKTKPSLTKSS